MEQKALTIEDIARKLKPVLGKKVDQLYLRYRMATSVDEREEISRVFQVLYERHLSGMLDKSILLAPPSAEKVVGEYPLANVSYNSKTLYPFALREGDWPRHVCISGMSGSGKTTLAFHILEQFIAKDKPFLVFDWKQSFRPLLARDDSIALFTIGNDEIANRFKMNILRPPQGIAPKEWLTVLVDLLAESFSVSFGVHKVLLETLDELFSGWNVYSDGKYFPTFHHVKKLLEDKNKKAKGREATWLESALRIATVLTFGSFGQIVNYDGTKRVSVEDLLSKRVIFELNALGTIEKKFFCEYVLMYLYKYRKSRNNRVGKHFDYAVVVDEAHNVFLKDKTNFSKESVTDMIYREMREYGTSLVCLDQHVSKLSDTVSGNSATHIAFQQQLPSDIHDISRIMQIGDQKDVFNQLPVGSAIVKLSERHTQPFLVSVADSATRHSQVDDATVKSRMKSFVMQLIAEQKRDQAFSEAVEEGTPLSDVHPLPKVDVTLNGEGTVRNVETVSTPTHALPRLAQAPQAMAQPAFAQEEQPIVYDVVTPGEKTQYTLPDVIEYAETLTLRERVIYDFFVDKVEAGETLLEVEARFRAKNTSAQACSTLEISRASEAVRRHLYGKQKALTPLPLSRFSVEQTPVVEPSPQPKASPKAAPIVVTPTEPQVTVINEAIAGDEDALLAFLQANPEHSLPTTKLYEQVGLSPRKGNEVKNALLEKGLIKVEEIRNQAGMKKFIKPVTPN